MRWSSALAEHGSLGEAVVECAMSIRDQLRGQTPDLIVAFVSAHHVSEYEELPSLIREHLGNGLLLGCSGGGVIGAGREVEHRPGLALTAALLPDVELTPFYLREDSLPDGDAPPGAWEDLVKTASEGTLQFLLLADPFTMRSEQLLMGLDYAFPGSVTVGGLASGAHQAGGNALYLSGDVYSSGAVAVALHGNIVVDTVVAQGCRPVGSPMLITASERNVLLEINGEPTLEALKDMFETLTELDQELVRHSLFLGVVMDELNDNPQPGDFLIRNIIGVEAHRQALVIGEILREGQIVQFHVRDAAASAKELETLLARYVLSHPFQKEAGALLFSCLGRGAHLYGHANHDTDMFHEKVGVLPLTGFFCNGEIGPVGGSTFLHAYTSSFGIFRPKDSG